jgi:hypothetical protein
MFQFTSFSPYTYYLADLGVGWQDITPAGLPHSEIPGLTVVAPTRGLSQLTASFIDFQRLGIHHAPLVSWSLRFDLLVRLRAHPPSNGM